MNNSKSVHNQADRPSQHSINQLKNQIKFVLNFNLHTKNESIDKYILESFNVFNPDPVYVFVLPNGSNRTIAFHRSNFSDISFPNTTSLQNIQNIFKSTKYAHLFRNTDDIASKQLQFSDNFFTKYKQFMTNENDIHDNDDNMKIVEENVRTEKNFIKFMDKLNENSAYDEETVEDSRERTPLESKQTPNDYKALKKEIDTKEHIGKFPLTNDHNNGKKNVWPTNEKSSWDDFGLHGWIGKINKEHKYPQENG